MVRTIVGVLMAIGCGDASEDWASERFLSRGIRTQGSGAASAHGLYFLGPTYGSTFDLLETVESRRF